jgi:hypothetical protein
MKKQELHFLLNLHEAIDKGCTLLEVGRDAFMPTMNRFFETVSLGIEMGLTMKGKAAKKSAKTAQAVDSVLGKNESPKVPFATRLVQVIGTQTLHLREIEAALHKAGVAPKSKDLRSYICSTLATAETADGKRTFTRSPERGRYFVTATKAQAKPTAKPSPKTAKPSLKPTTPKPTKPKPKKAVKTKKKALKKDPQRSLKVTAVIKTHLEKGPMRLQDLLQVVRPMLHGIKDPQQAIWKMLKACPEIESVPKQKGCYRLKAVMNGKTKSTIVSAPASAAN